MARRVRLDGLTELLEQQLAVVSRGQLLALGMDDNAMQYRVRSGGPWQVLLPGVYLGVTGTPNLLQKEMAAQLYAGPASLITSGPIHLVLTARAVADTARQLTSLRDVRAVVADAVQLGRWPDAGVCAEVDSRQWHLSPEAWERTMNRHDLMGEFGIIPLHFSPRKIRHEPAEVIQRIKGALESGLNRPPLPIRTIPCPTARRPSQ